MTTAAFDARAQQGGSFALDTFHPAPSGDRFFAVQDPHAGAGDATQLSFTLLGEYARDPLVLYTVVDDETGESAGTVVSDQLFLHFGLSAGFFGRALLSVDFPAGLLNQGDSPAVGGTTFTSPDGVSSGDLRLGLRLRLIGQRTLPFGAAVTGELWLPTGDDKDFAGEGTVRGSPGLALGGRIGSLVWAANGGILLRSGTTFAGTEIGHEITFGAALAGLAADERLQIGPELYGAATVEGADQLDSKTTNLEALLGVKYRAGPVVIGAGVGPGLSRGVGTPAVRGVLSVAYAPPDDRDGDGVIDADDACPELPGPRSIDPKRTGCPLVEDRDRDGVLDREDACPDVQGLRSAEPPLNGCPDSDRDGIFDKVDACPDLPGLRNADPRKNGCTAGDRDRDGIVDDADACPDVPGSKSDDKTKNGCPADRDGDRILDDKDACPDLLGVAATDPAKNGCPPDTDGDGISDDKDACPKEPGQADPDPAKNGCPRVFVAQGRIEILEQVHFKTGSDAILPESDALLQQVADVLSSHPEIVKVTVLGHTDSVGDKGFNKELSDRRAASVKKWLATRGKIDAKRLDSKGYGAERPVADNATDEGRQKNRRVEFEINDTKPGTQGGGAKPVVVPRPKP
jgi:outer membrane protein OmpA-like peptidoglycan-associated protein